MRDGRFLGLGGGKLRGGGEDIMISSETWRPPMVTKDVIRRVSVCQKKKRKMSDRVWKKGESEASIK